MATHPVLRIVPVLLTISQAASVLAILTGGEDLFGWNAGIATQP